MENKSIQEKIDSAIQEAVKADDSHAIQAIEELKASLPEPMPVTEQFSKPVTGALIQMLIDRSINGASKYKSVLRTYNGRNPLIDALQESTDLNQYLLQALMEAEDLMRYVLSDLEGYVFSNQEVIGKKVYLSLGETDCYGDLCDEKRDKYKETGIDLFKIFTSTIQHSIQCYENNFNRVVLQNIMEPEIGTAKN